MFITLQGPDWRSGIRTWGRAHLHRAASKKPDDDHPLRVRTIQFDPRSRAVLTAIACPHSGRIATSHGDHIIRIWRTEVEGHEPLIGHSRTAWTLSFHPWHRDLFVSGSLFLPQGPIHGEKRGELIIWKMGQGTSQATPLRVWRPRASITSLDFHPDGRELFLAKGNCVTVLDMTAFLHAVPKSGSRRPLPPLPPWPTSAVEMTPLLTFPSLLRAVRFAPCGTLLHTVEDVTNDEDWPGDSASDPGMRRCQIQLWGIDITAIRQLTGTAWLDDQESPAPQNITSDSSPKKKDPSSSFSSSSRSTPPSKKTPSSAGSKRSHEDMEMNSSSSSSSSSSSRRRRVVQHTILLQDSFIGISPPRPTPRISADFSHVYPIPIPPQPHLRPILPPSFWANQQQEVSRETMWTSPNPLRSSLASPILSSTIAASSNTVPPLQSPRQEAFRDQLLAVVRRLSQSQSSTTSPIFSSSPVKKRGGAAASSSSSSSSSIEDGEIPPSPDFRVCEPKLALEADSGPEAFARAAALAQKLVSRFEWIALQSILPPSTPPAQRNATAGLLHPASFAGPRRAPVYGPLLVETDALVFSDASFSIASEVGGLVVPISRGLTAQHRVDALRSSTCEALRAASAAVNRSFTMDCPSPTSPKPLEPKPEPLQDSDSDQWEAFISGAVQGVSGASKRAQVAVQRRMSNGRKRLPARRNVRLSSGRHSLSWMRTRPPSIHPRSTSPPPTKKSAPVIPDRPRRRALFRVAGGGLDGKHRTYPFKTVPLQDHDQRQTDSTRALLAAEAALERDDFDGRFRLAPGIIAAVCADPLFGTVGSYLGVASATPQEGESVAIPTCLTVLGSQPRSSPWVAAPWPSPKQAGPLHAASPQFSVLVGFDQSQNFWRPPHARPEDDAIDGHALSLREIEFWPMDIPPSPSTTTDQQSRIERLSALQRNRFGTVLPEDVEDHQPNFPSQAPTTRSRVSFAGVADDVEYGCLRPSLEVRTWETSLQPDATALALEQKALAKPRFFGTVSWSWIGTQRVNHVVAPYNHAGLLAIATASPDALIVTPSE